MRASASAFFDARDFLLRHRSDYERAYRHFRWPVVSEFNWALDYFDEIARGNERTALWLCSEGAPDIRISFADLADRSNRAANFLRHQGVSRGDTLMVMLPAVPAMWEVMLAAIKLGAVIVPAAALLTPADLRDRIKRGAVKHVVAEASEAGKFAQFESGALKKISVGKPVAGWANYTAAYDESAHFEPRGQTRATDPLLIYFTSGTTALPKMVVHSHQSYPIGHLATMYWVGLQSEDVHMNISSPGWAKHAWSSFFAPWNAGATVFVHQYARFDPVATLKQIARCGVTTLCAPPTVWRMFILEDLPSYSVKLREVVSAGEPLNPEVVARVRAAWGLTIRDGFGQTETTCLLGNSPGQRVKPGSVGRPTPGHAVELLDLEGNRTNEGEVCLSLSAQPLSLFESYRGDPERTAQVRAGDFYRTGDLASRDADGYYTYIGRADDVFKSSDYRISPFELESALLEHPAVAESAVVPSPDEARGTVPKAFVVLKPSIAATSEIAREIFAFMRERVGPHKRIRRIEFAELPKTISGKTRRVELRARESDPQRSRGSAEYWEEDFTVHGPSARVR